MGTIYRVHEGNPRLHYCNNTFDYYTRNTEKVFIFYLLKTIEKTSYKHITAGWKIKAIPSKITASSQKEVQELYTQGTIMSCILLLIFSLLNCLDHVNS
jgi:hypothetical protein